MAAGFRNVAHVPVIVKKKLCIFSQSQVIAASIVRTFANTLFFKLSDSENGDRVLQFALKNFVHVIINT